MKSSRSKASMSGGQFMLLHAKAASTTWLCMEFVMGDGYFTVIHYFAPFSITQRFWSQYFHRKHCRAPRTEWSACIRAAGFLSACGKGRQCSWAVHPRYTDAPAHTGFWRAGLSFSAPRWIRPTAFQTAPEENQISAGWLWVERYFYFLLLISVHKLTHVSLLPISNCRTV